MAIKIDVTQDTNILLRTTFDEKSKPTVASRAWLELHRRGHAIGTTVANLAEFANVATRPVSANGLGLSTRQTQDRIRLFERRLVIFSESLESYDIWKRLVEQYDVHGAKVHDTRIVAIMLQSDIPAILTFNAADFRRFPEIVTLHPDDILTKA